MSDWQQPTYDEMGRIADSRKVIIEANEVEITRLRTLLSEADQREKDARRVALEEAAMYHEYRANNHAAAHKHVVSDFHQMMEKMHRDAADDIRYLDRAALERSEG